MDANRIPIDSNKCRFAIHAEELTWLWVIFIFRARQLAENQCQTHSALINWNCFASQLKSFWSNCLDLREPALKYNDSVRKPVCISLLCLFNFSLCFRSLFSSFACVFIYTFCASSLPLLRRLKQKQRSPIRKSSKFRATQHAHSWCDCVKFVQPLENANARLIFRFDTAPAVIIIY